MTTSARKRDEQGKARVGLSISRLGIDLTERVGRGKDAYYAPIGVRLSKAEAVCLALLLIKAGQS